jgi:2-aminoadipate transaminase
MEAVRAASERVLHKHGSKSLQYGESEGVVELRAHLANQNGVSTENILITSGGQQGLDLIGRVLLDSGDLVLVENPTYLALLSAWRPLEVSFGAIGSDQEGLIIREVAQSLQLRPKLLYVVPNFQNPQGTTLSLQRRVELAELSRNLISVEDDPYGELRYEGDTIPSLFEIGNRVEGSVIKVGTFSKVLAPGFRIGWIIAAAELIDKLVQAKQAADLHTSTFNQYLALELVSAGVVDQQIPLLRDEYRRRRDAMLAELATHMPAGVDWTKPAGGMFLLVTLPEGCSAADLAQLAIQDHVLIVPGEDFHIVGGTNTFRLNFSNADPKKIREGIARLGPLVSEAIEKADRAIGTQQRAYSL